MSQENDETKPNNVKRNIRHAEKRRTATCSFADRVARISIDHYRRVIPLEERLPQTCLATVVAHEMPCNDTTGKLTVLSMGVGTKFLSESTLQEEAGSPQYGQRVRDCHAEVLARRGFRRALSLEMIRHLRKPMATEGILCQNSSDSTQPIRFQLRPNVSLHLYTSSAPCGNSTLKRFAKMSKEKFRQDLGPDQWPLEPHESVHYSSVQLGQVALLIKKDSESKTDNGNIESNVSKRPRVSPELVTGREKTWPANLTDDWTPPGTTIVCMQEKGSIHTCSDKICRWNYLGIQGSLLASMLKEPLYLSTLTVGRKLTECICRRAVCCRLEHGLSKSKKQKETPLGNEGNAYRKNHPAILGTAVYMDETGAVETNSEVRGQDIRFHSSRSWCWWSSIEEEETQLDTDVGTGQEMLYECIDGSTGYLATDDDKSRDEAEKKSSNLSKVCSEALTSLFLHAYQLSNKGAKAPTGPTSLDELHKLKHDVSAVHEEVKVELLTKHRILRQWRRR